MHSRTFAARGTPLSVFLALAAVLALSSSTVWSFTPSIRDSRIRRFHSMRRFATPDALKQQPHESNAAYLRRLQQLASDPKAFENAVRGSKTGTSKTEKHATHRRHVVSHKSFDCDESNVGSSAPTTTNGQRRGYQRAEEWDKEQEDIRKSMGWEERVQYDGQRYGNRFNQNEILRHNLKSF